MDVDRYKKELKSQLASVGADDILNELICQIDSKSSLFDDIILLQTRHRDLVKSKRTNTIEDEEYLLQLNKLNKAVLSVIDGITTKALILEETKAEQASSHAGANIIPQSVFLSTPMSTLNDADEFRLFKSTTNEIQEVLRYELDYNIIYYAGNTVDGLDDFHTPEASILQDFKAILSCEKFLMIYPKKYPSSTLVEVGYAMSLNREIIIFTTTRSELPFLLSMADKVYQNIRIFELDDIAKIPAFLKNIM